MPLRKEVGVAVAAGKRRQLIDLYDAEVVELLVLSNADTFELILGHEVHSYSDLATFGSYGIDVVADNPATGVYRMRVRGLKAKGTELKIEVGNTGASDITVSYYILWNPL